MNELAQSSVLSGDGGGEWFTQFPGKLSVQGTEGAAGFHEGVFRIDQAIGGG